MFAQGHKVFLLVILEKQGRSCAMLMAKIAKGLLRFRTLPNSTQQKTDASRTPSSGMSNALDSWFLHAASVRGCRAVHRPAEG